MSTIANAKRSASALASIRPSPTKNNNSDELLRHKASTLNYNAHFQLYSKSASSMKELTGSIKSLLSEEDYTEKNLDSPRSDQKLGLRSAGSTIGTTTGYKYTPLRQSWSNLTQMNSLSPHSMSSSSHNMDENRKTTLYEENVTTSGGLNEEHRDRISDHLSPSIPRTTRKITTNRPLTADSVLSRSSSVSKASSDFGATAETGLRSLNIFN